MHSHPEPCSSTPQSNSGFAGTPVWAKDLAGCFGRNCWWRLFGQAPLASWPKSLSSGISVGNIPGDPSPKRGAQDDSTLKMGKSICMDHGVLWIGGLLYGCRQRSRSRDERRLRSSCKGTRTDAWRIGPTHPLRQTAPPQVVLRFGVSKANRYDTNVSITSLTEINPTNCFGSARCETGKNGQLPM